MKKKIVIVGGGNAGSVIANLLAEKLDVTVIEPNDYHVYQPGLVDYMIGYVNKEKIIKPINMLLKPSVRLVKARVRKIIAEDRAVITEDDKKYEADYLVIATGGVNKTLFNVRGYHTLVEGNDIREIINSPKGKNFVIGSLPGVIKCPAAPWEISFLLKSKYPEANVTILIPSKQPPPIQLPMSTLFSKIASSLGIKILKGFVISEVNYDSKTITSTEGEKIGFDHLIIDTPITATFPDLVDNSGLIPVDKHTLLHKDGVFVVGDANNTPTPKTGAAAHLQAETVVNNILAEVEGNRGKELYRGDAMCALYTSKREGALVWLNYERSKVLGPSPIYRYMKEMFINLYWSSLNGGIDILLKPMISSIGKEK